MKINHKNIEAYLLDYLEGNLDPMVTAELMAFLTEHPEYEKCMPALDFLMPVATVAKYTGKDALKKDFCDIPYINAGNFEEFCIAYSEQLLQQPEIDRLFQYIGNDSHKQEIVSLYSKLRVMPDEKIKFTGKSKLKKPVPFRITLPRADYILSIAAALMLVYLLIKPRFNHEENQMALANYPVTGNAAPTSEKVIDSRQQANEIMNSSVYEIAVTSYPKKTSPLDDKKPDAASTPASAEAFAMQSLEPITVNSLQPVDHAFPITSPALSKPDHPKRESDQSESEGLLSTLLARVDIWKTAKTAIQGFNQLTEAQLSISKTYDEQGRVSGMLFNTESYSIESSTKK
jgi:hypothetical protein